MGRIGFVRRYRVTMKPLLFLPIAALLFVPAPPSGPLAQSRWQRVLTPSLPLRQAEQCVVVDAALYAHAAPGLRDVRLLQDGREIPYATDVSFDDRTGEAGAPPPDDRAQYEPVRVLSLAPAPRGDGEAAETGHYFTEDLISAHVPVERVRLTPAPSSVVQLSLRAAARMNLAEAEELHTALGPARAAAPFTVGANLQDEADISVSVRQGHDVPPPQSVVLEMRRREICYQPISASPIRLLLGNAGADPPHYDYALHFQPKASPLLATMGPMQPNPDYVAPVQPVRFRMTTGLRLTIAAIVAIGAFFATAVPLLRLTKR